MSKIITSTTGGISEVNYKNSTTGGLRIVNYKNFDHRRLKKSTCSTKSKSSNQQL